MIAFCYLRILYAIPNKVLKERLENRRVTDNGTKNVSKGAGVTEEEIYLVNPFKLW